MGQAHVDNAVLYKTMIISTERETHRGKRCAFHTMKLLFTLLKWNLTFKVI